MTLRAAKRPRFSVDPDLEIEVENEVVLIHSYPVMTLSGVFRRMLESGMSEAQTGRITLPGKSMEDFRLVLPWLSLAMPKPKITQTNLVTQLQWAREYEIQDLQNACENYLLKRRADIVPALQFAIEFGLSRRIDQCVVAISEDIAKHIHDLEQISDNEAVMQLLWPRIFQVLELSAPSEPLPAQPSIRHLWPILARAVEFHDLAKTGSIVINIKTLTRKNFQLKVKPSDSVLALKNMIQDKEGIPPSQQRLVHKGQMCQDSESLAAFGVCHGSMLHLILRLAAPWTLLGSASFIAEQILSSPAMETYKLTTEEMEEVETFALGPSRLGRDAKVVVCPQILGPTQCKALIDFIDRGFEYVNTIKQDSTQLDDFQFELSNEELRQLVGNDTLQVLLTRCFRHPSQLAPPIYILRRVCPNADFLKCVSFHRDAARTTLNVFLNSDDEYEGGRFVYIDHYQVFRPRCLGGSGIVFDDALLHGVTQLCSGKRYNLLVTWDGMSEVPVPRGKGMDRGFPFVSAVLPSQFSVKKTNDHC